MTVSHVLCTLSLVAAFNTGYGKVCVGGAQYLYSCLCMHVAFLKYSNLEERVVLVCFDCLTVMTAQMHLNIMDKFLVAFTCRILFVEAKYLCIPATQQKLES